MANGTNSGRLRPTQHKTLIAAVLTLGAILVPSLYWYVSGTRALEAEQAEITEAPARLAGDAAGRIAQRVGDRLNALAGREADRPFFHYQNLFVDPRGAYEGQAVAPSPLAEGPGDPLIRSNFQVDDSGVLTMPTVNPELVGVKTTDADPDEGELALLCASIPPYLAENGQILAPPADEAPAIPEQVAAAPNPQQLQAAIQDHAFQLQAEPFQEQIQVQRLSNDNYNSNVRANEVYWEIQQKNGNSLPPLKGQRKKSRIKEPAIDQDIGLVLQDVGSDGTPTLDDVLVRVGALTWNTINIDATPSLVALRKVETPDGERTQGFVVSLDALSPLLVDGEHRAELRPGRSSRVGESPLRLAGTHWHVAVDYGALDKAAAAEVTQMASAFGWRFGIGTALALLAGLAVILMIWQSERLSQRRVQFAAAAAHELRTPLAGLRMYGEMLAEGLGNPDRQKTYARRVATEADRLGRVVSNVLDFTRLERGAVQVSVTPGDLGQAVRDILVRLEPNVVANGATLEATYDAAVKPVSFDRDLLAQVLGNLVDNAEKYGREADDRRISIHVEPDGDDVTIRVRDRGPGISSALRRRLFQTFTRGANPDQPAGLGLGLSLSRALIDAQGGSLQCESPSDGGAAFVIRLPAVQA